MLLQRLRAQAQRHGIDVTPGSVEELQSDGTGFVARSSAGEIAARCVLLATGMVVKGYADGAYSLEAAPIADR